MPRLAATNPNFDHHPNNVNVGVDAGDIGSSEQQQHRYVVDAQSSTTDFDEFPNIDSMIGGFCLFDEGLDLDHHHIHMLYSNLQVIHE